MFCYFEVREVLVWAGEGHRLLCNSTQMALKVMALIITEFKHQNISYDIVCMPVIIIHTVVDDLYHIVSCHFL